MFSQLPLDMGYTDILILSRDSKLLQIQIVQIQTNQWTLISGHVCHACGSLVLHGKQCVYSATNKTMYQL